MKLRLLAAALAALTLTAGVASAQDTTSDKGKLSYALGYQLGRQAAESGEALDLAAMTRALQDGYAKKDPAVPMEQMRSAYEGMQQRLGTKAKAAYEKAASENKPMYSLLPIQHQIPPHVLGLTTTTRKVSSEVFGERPATAMSLREKLDRSRFEFKAVRRKASGTLKERSRNWWDQRKSNNNRRDARGEARFTPV